MLQTVKCIFGHFTFLSFWMNLNEWINYLGVVLNPAAAKLGTKLLLGCCGGMNDFVDLGFSVPGNSPTMIFPANEGLTFLPKSCCFFGGLVIPLMMIGVRIYFLIKSLFWVFDLFSCVHAQIQLCTHKKESSNQNKLFDNMLE